MLRGKHILLGITGSIAAYKSAMLVRALVKEGAEVKVVMTKMAKEFITPLTMATLSKNPILVDFYNPENGDWNSHVSLGMWSDLYLIAPASANTIAKMANGVADNLLLTTYLSAKCPVAVAPAMDLDMYSHVATQDNLDKLRERGVYIIEPESGELASGLIGKGRMSEVDEIVANVDFILSKGGSLNQKKVLITGGPTVEHIDPVRYISNHSSGKMACALADEAAARGAEVYLVAGPMKVAPKSKGVKIINVVSADQMFNECAALTPYCDIVILCAAVADYSVLNAAHSKIKRGEGSLTLQLTPNRDIAAWVGKNKKEGAVAVGFALETDNAKVNALDKLNRKNLDMIVLNSMAESGAGFNGDTNRVDIFFKSGEEYSSSLKSKKDIAVDIVNSIEKICL